MRDSDHALPPSRSQYPVQALALAALCLVLFGWNLGGRDLWSSHEARAAQNAQTILDTGDWVALTLFDGRPDYQKPPMFYWLAALAGWLNGGRVDAWTVRLPAAVSGLILVLTVHGFLWRRGRRVEALIAGMVLVTTSQIIWLARTARIDLPLAAAVAAAVLAWVEASACERGAWRWRLLSAAAMSAGVMLKGPIGLLMPAAVVSVWTLTGPGVWRDKGRQLTVLTGYCLLAVTAAVPWFVAMDARTGGEFTREFFFRHHWQRALGPGAEDSPAAPHADTAYPIWYYAPAWLAAGLPWSPLVLVAAVWWLRGNRWAADPVARLGLVWLAVIVGGLSLARFKRADYLVPAQAGATLILACAAQCWAVSERSRRIVLALGIGGIVLSGSVWVYQLAVREPVEDARREQRTFARAVRSLHPAPGGVILFRVEDHALAFHLGRHLNTVLEWENLDVWAGRPGAYLIMTAGDFARWPEFARSGRLDKVLDGPEPPDGGRPERRLVLVRAAPAEPPVRPPP